MSKALSDLLGQPEHILTSFIETLERLSGQASEDIRLLNEVSHQIMAKNLSLGLDPIDTNGQELYHALQSKFASDCSNFENIIGKDKKTSIDKKLSRLAKLADHSGVKREIWALKQPVAKELLRVHPPKALMRQLHYRSVDSMLKHEDIAGLYAALPLTTSSSWQRGFSKTQSKLSPLDFETRALQIINLPSKRWQGIVADAPTINRVNELGAVVLWPTTIAEKVDTLAMLALVVRAVSEVHTVSSVAKASQGHGAYGTSISKIWRGELPSLATLAGHALGWQSILHYLGRQPELDHPVEFEPYLYPQDLHWQNANERIAALHPSLAWWRDGSHLLHAVKNGSSLNLADVSLNHIHGSEFGQKSVTAGRQDFWDELLGRYLQHPRVFDRIAGQLEQNLSPVTIRVIPDEVNLQNLSRVAQAA